MQINCTVIKDHIEVIYIKLREGISHHSRELDDEGDVVLNLDKDGHLLGIELLTPIPVGAMDELKRVSKEFHVPELERVNPRKLEEAYA